MIGISRDPRLGIDRVLLAPSVAREMASPAGRAHVPPGVAIAPGGERLDVVDLDCRALAARQLQLAFGVGLEFGRAKLTPASGRRVGRATRKIPPTTGVLIGGRTASAGSRKAPCFARPRRCAAIAARDTRLMSVARHPAARAGCIWPGSRAHAERADARHRPTRRIATWYPPAAKPLPPRAGTARWAAVPPTSPLPAKPLGHL
jgi:hypothetical protein